MHYTESDEITSKDFADLMNRHKSWGALLARESIKMGNEFPRKKYGNIWVATIQEWKKALDMVGWSLYNTKRDKNREN